MTDLERQLTSHVDRATPGAPPPYDDVLARRARRRTRRRAGGAVIGGAAAVVLIVAGTAILGSDDGGTDPSAPVATSGQDVPSPTASLEPPDWDGVGVPPLTLMLSDRMVVLAPWSYCYGNACVDGKRPEHFDDVGSPEQVAFSFPVPGWRFEVTFTEAGVTRPRSETVRATPTSDTMFEITPPVRPGTYEVDLFGRGEGDVSFVFTWTVPG